MDIDKILLHSIAYFATEKRHSFLKIHPCNKNVKATFSVTIDDDTRGLGRLG